MSEQILERPATTDRSGSGLTEFDEPESGTSRKRTYLVVGLAVVAGLILGTIVLFVMRGRAAQEAEAAAAATQAQAVAAAEAAAATAAAQAAQPVVPGTRTRVRITSRDPFAPLIPAPPPPPPAPSAPRTAGPSGDGSSSAGSSSATGATISALSISGSADSVKLKLDGKPYNVDMGETFAKAYRLYSIFDGDCAGFLYGDQNAVVCEGGSVTLG